MVLSTTRANNVNQSARLFKFCVLGQSECLKFEVYKQRSEKITPCSTPSVHKKFGRFGSFIFVLFSPHQSRHVFKYYLSHLASEMRHNDPGQYRMTHKHSLHIRLAKGLLSDLRERLIFANKLFTRVSFCSSSGSSSIVIGCLTFFVALVLFKASRRSKQR